MTGAAAATVNLHPEHRADCRRSGLSDETIDALGIHSARPGDIARLVGFDPPNVTSVLVFPYPGEDGFSRVKVFPPCTDRNGHTVKYLQRPKSGVRLYVPPLAAKVLEDPTIPLSWTEGEKKAAKANQEDVPCVGLGGLWNWIEDGHPIAKLNEIAHADREEIIFPDSDVWSRLDLLKAVYALGKDLEGRGAKVTVAIIPPGQDGRKRGLDDYLVNATQTNIPAPEALAKLKRLPLKHSAFTGAALWWKQWSKAREARTEPPADALKLLEKIERRRLLYPAQDFEGGVFHFGLPADDDVLLVTSDRTLIRAEQLPDGARMDNRGFDLCRFSKDGITRFLGGANIDTPTALSGLRQFFARFVVFRDERIPLLLAVWALGTYCYRVFRVFPYLAFRSPSKRCGKSRALDLLALTAFNASSRVTNPTEAQLFRGPARNGGTLLLDEIESLKGDKDTFAGLLAVLNSGFERGGSVARLEKRGDRFEEITFPTYAPRALAGINRLAETLEDRSIILFMARKLRSERTERFSPGRLAAEAQTLRDSCYTWTLSHAADLAEVYEADGFPGMQALDDRARDLWEPLVSIAMLADAEAEGSGFAETLIALAGGLSGVRDEGETTTAKLIEALGEILKAEGRESYTPTELLHLLQGHGFDWLKSTRALAGLLHPLGFFATKRRNVKHVVRAYCLSDNSLTDLRIRYGDASETPEEGT